MACLDEENEFQERPGSPKVRDRIIEGLTYCALSFGLYLLDTEEP